MCHHIQILNTTKNGSISHCNYCMSYHVIFGHFHYEFSQQELEKFKITIRDTDIEYWEKRYATDLMKRKIPILTSQDNLCLMLNRSEFLEIKRLLLLDKKDNILRTITTNDIDYDISSN